MLYKKINLFILSILMIGAAVLSGCGLQSGADSIPSSDAQTNTAQNTPPMIEYAFSDEDTDASWNAAASTTIVFNGNTAQVSGGGAAADGSRVTISEAGTYVISGSTDDGQVIVYAEKKDLVRLVLNGLDIASKSSAPIHVMSADKTVIILASDTENTVSDAVSYAQTDADGEPNAAVFSKDDLTITGDGALTVNAANSDAICSKDILAITGGKIDITAADDGLRGTDGVAISDGTLKIKAASKGIRSTKDEDASAEDATDSAENVAERGFVLIDGGTIRISECKEGIEAPRIELNGGDIDIEASDDAINAAGSSSTGAGGPGQPPTDGEWAGKPPRDEAVEWTEAPMPDEAVEWTETPMPGEGMRGEMPTSDYYLRITGGRINLLGNNDGIDANGNIYIEGGDISISSKSSGADGAIDADGSVTVTGGNLITAGSAPSPSADSTQASILVSYSAQQAQGSVISLRDADGKTLLEYTSRIAFSASAFSSPALEIDAIYTLFIDGEKRTDITLTDLTTTIADDGSAYTQMNGMGGGFGGGTGRKGQAPPDGMTGGPRSRSGAGASPDDAVPADRDTGRPGRETAQ
jgi:hypothetical protein